MIDCSVFGQDICSFIPWVPCMGLGVVRRNHNSTRYLHHLQKSPGLVALRVTTGVSADSESKQKWKDGMCIQWRPTVRDKSWTSAW